MRLTCPACGACGSIEFFLMDVAARKAVLEALNLQPVMAKQVMAYIGLFRPGKRALTWDRTEKLLSELVGPIKDAQVERHGRTWPAPLEFWKDALDQILTKREKLQLPLKSHGYLFEIVAGMANKSEGRAEVQREEARAHGLDQQRSGNAMAVGDVISGAKKPKSGPPPGWKDDAFNQRGKDSDG